MRGKQWMSACLCAFVAVLGLVACSGSSSAGAVTLESANTSGTDPFSASIAIGPAVAFPANVQAIATSTRKTLKSDTKTKTLVASGTAPGLYGGTGNVHVCNATQLVTFLQQNPAKAAAWAGVLGISPANIGSYAASLTPVVLMSDTRVTNHGYANGHATTLQSVLQAGTAVMVDNTGTPRVKCNCGNPLTPPEPLNLSAAHTQGSRWTGYSGTNVTTVLAGPPAIQITVINITTGDTYTQPVGSSSTPPSTIPPVSGTAPCSEATIWFGVTQGVPANEKPGLHLDKFQCSGSWAYASWKGESGGSFATVLHFDTGKLLGEWVVDAGACGQGTVPAEIASAGCSGGASGPSTPTTTATTSSAPCTTAAIQADLNSGGSGQTTVQTEKCFGDYAQVFTSNGQYDSTGLIHWNGTKWVGDEQACNASQPPPGLSAAHWKDACSTTG